jgi:hypothetical protein
MTLPSSGQISISDVNAEVGRALTVETAISWIQANTKDGVTDLNSIHGRSWYVSTNDGNCNNGNCTAESSSGNIQCQNCTITNLGNCSNCDTRPWLQPGTNCNCTYACDAAADQTYACNCACACACACACFICACACW